MIYAITLIFLFGSIMWLPVWAGARAMSWKLTHQHERFRSHLEWWALISVLFATGMFVLAMALVGAYVYTSVGIFFATLINLFMAVVAYCSVYDRSRAFGRAVHDRLCGECGYDTRGLPSRCTVCPECGTTLLTDVPEPEPAHPVPLDRPRARLDPRAGDGDPRAPGHRPTPPPPA